MAPKSIEHFIPLMSVDTLTLEKYKCSVIKRNAISSEHPIYYFSEKLSIPTDEVAKKFAKHNNAFFKCNPNRLKSKLNLLLEHDVKPSSILNYEWTFRYSDTLIKQNITTLKCNGIDKIDSYVIVDSSRKKSLMFDHMMEKQSLDGFENNMVYLAHRLGWNQSDLFSVIKKYPKLSKCSAQKIKEHLDYFLNETKFTALDIASFPYIFGKNLDCIKTRIKQMTDIGASVKLYILYQDKITYTKLIQKYLDKSGRELSTHHGENKNNETIS